MSVYGWDCSHYDGTLTRAIMSRARSEGIAFVTHKIGEGTGYDDPGDLTALAAARDAGIEFVGGYFVPRSGSSVAAQVDACVRLADRDEPWWRTFPGWFWQVDLERWSYDNVPASVGIAFAKELRARTGRWTVLYASHGQYGNALTGWDGPLWNAHYVSHAAAGFAAMYPGDGWKPKSDAFAGGWSAYSGKEPTFLQYTSSATIAGLTTCDANAFRGSAADLRALIKGGGTDVVNEAVFGVPEQDAYSTLNILLAIEALEEDHGGGTYWQGKLSPRSDEFIRAIKRIDTNAATAANRPAATVTLSAADLDALAKKVAALLAPLVATPAAQVADELAKRLGNG
jgi:hypothetical protein